MKINLIENDERKIKFSVSETTPAFVNAIRRISMEHIPILAIEDVAIQENSSALFDEMLAQRMGLIPLEFDPDKYNLKEECDCGDGCTECQAEFSLQKEGPGKAYSGDIIPENSSIKPLYENIPITEMDEDQEVELEATAIVSTGEDHSKHQAAITSYQYYPKIKINQDKIDDAETCTEICPAGVFKTEGDELVVENIEKCTLCRECEENCKKGAIEISGDKTKFIVSLESISGLEPSKILEITTNILERKGKEITEKLE